MAERPDISRVVENGLCHSCGACSGVCPAEAVRFEETAAGFVLPVVDPVRCTACGRCLAACPGESFGEALARSLPPDPFTGSSIRSYIGRAADDRVFARAQSGGVATALLLHALRAGDIAGAVVVSMPPGVRPRPVARIARTVEEILDARGSKYCPVPLLDAIRRIGDLPGPAAVTGLSCHLHGLLNMVSLDPGLRERIGVRVGLICDRSLSCAAIDYLAGKAGFADGDEIEMVFRDKSCNGYPGDVRVSAPGGRSVVLADRHRRRIKPYLTPPRCHLCFDKMNVLSDVTIGDPHGLRYADQENGESICTVRTTAGLELVRSALAARSVELREIPYPDVVRGQKIDAKRTAWRGFLEEWRSSGRPIPDYAERISLSAGGPAAASGGASVAYALRLSSIEDRARLLEWIRRNDRRDAAAGVAKTLSGYARLAVRRAGAAGRRDGAAAGTKLLMIEVRKAGFVNKGAELMLIGVLDRIRRELPRADIAMAPDRRTAPYHRRAALGLYQKVWLQRYRVQWGFLGALIPRPAREFFGLVLDSEVDAVLDASGFSYSDQIGLSSTLATARAVRRWKRRGTKVILLPQAFGPFEDRRIRASMRYIAEHADLIYARDEVSYRHLVSLTGERDHIRIAPDFTCLVDGTVPDGFDPLEHRFCIIPNHRMLQKTPPREAAGYLSFLLTCCRYLDERGQKPFFLIHEGRKDLDIARQVADSLGSGIPIVDEPDALAIKGIIGSSRAVIGSRYHGLVSALSQGVPALAVGWSHKYEMLFRDYGVEDGLVDVTAPDEEIARRIEELIDDGERSRIADRLKEESRRQKALAGKMWEEVVAALKEGNPG